MSIIDFDESKIQNLTSRERLILTAHYLGYKKLPPTINQFIHDNYYLGNYYKDSIYPYWIEILNELFPDEITNAYPIIISTGAIGTGKSTLSRIIALYLYCRLDHLKDLKLFGLAGDKPMQMVFSHTTDTKAFKDFIRPINKVMEESPYFMEGLISNPDIELITDGVRKNAGIGGDVIYFNLSELNFLPYDRALSKIEDAIDRFTSRFLPIKNFFGNVILDTSTDEDDSVVEEFLKNNPHIKAKIIRTSQWEAKKHLNIYFRTGHFYVYAGDAEHPPKILTDDGSSLDMTYDSSRVIKVPNELYDNFKSNLEKALRNLAGVSIRTGEKFFSNSEDLDKTFILPSEIPDIIYYDFYNLEDKVIDKIKNQLKYLPTHKKLFLRFDLGTTGDLTGFAISYLEGFRTIPKSDVKIPIIVTPLIVSISRYTGEATSILHLEILLKDLSKLGYDIACITYDSYGTTEFNQNLNRDGYYAYVSSVDRTDEAYIFWKNLIIYKTWTGASNELAKKEAKKLERVGKKIDHPDNGSKDATDAVAGSVLSIYHNLELASEISKTYTLNRKKKVYETYDTFSNSKIQNALNDGIFS